MPILLSRGVVYLLFLLSGAAALVYQVVWVRSLTLVFGGSHLAVTVVLAVFMGGLALGAYAAGRFVDRVGRPLRVYGVLDAELVGSTSPLLIDETDLARRMAAPADPPSPSSSAATRRTRDHASHGGTGRALSLERARALPQK